MCLIYQRVKRSQRINHNKAGCPRKPRSGKGYKSDALTLQKHDRCTFPAAALQSVRHVPKPLVEYCHQSTATPCNDLRRLGWAPCAATVRLASLIYLTEIWTMFSCCVQWNLSEKRKLIFSESYGLAIKLSWSFAFALAIICLLLIITCSPYICVSLLLTITVYKRFCGICILHFFKMSTFVSTKLRFYESFQTLTRLRK